MTAADPRPAWLECPGCLQRYAIPDLDNMQDALDVIEAHIAAHPYHLRSGRCLN